MPNNRIYYAIQQVVMGKRTADDTVVHGLQSVGITTNFNLEQVFEMGQLNIYQNVEGVPDIEVTLNKVLDGYPLIYTLATEQGSDAGGVVATSPTLPGRQNARVDVSLSVFADTGTSATGTALQSVKCDGMYVSSISYTFPVDGNFTEDVTLVGNNKIWGAGLVATDAASATSMANDTDVPEAQGGVGRRQLLAMSSCKFPKQIPGINSSTGANPAIGGGSGFGAHFQNITVSCDLGREAINELGTLVPYFRYVTFPVEVTAEFEVIGISGDMIQASESGYYEGLTGSVVASSASAACIGRHNLLSEEIFIQTCEGTKIYLGDKNKLTSVSFSGGDTGGGNVSMTYSYSTYNDFVVAHSSMDFYANVTSSGYVA